MTSWLRRRYKLLAILGVVAVTALGLVLWAAQGRPQVAVPPDVRPRAMGMLSQAKTWEELRAAAAGLGTILVCQDGSWIAIHYEDSHAADSFWSYAVALDSDGNWYDSRVHYCGTFLSKPNAATQEELGELEGKLVAGTITEEEPIRVHGWKDGEWSFLKMPGALYAIERAPNLAEAQYVMAKIGFRPLDELTTPAFKGRAPRNAER